MVDHHKLWATLVVEYNLQRYYVTLCVEIVFIIARQALDGYYIEGACSSV